LKEEVVELHAIVHGRVQGVSFRAITTEFARDLDLCGTVANLPNGTVEIFAQGTQKQLESLLQQLQGPRGPGVISSIDKEYKKPSKQFQGFKIVR
jgi:acylphosphatase